MILYRCDTSIKAIVKRCAEPMPTKTPQLEYNTMKKRKYENE